MGNWFQLYKNWVSIIPTRFLKKKLPDFFLCLYIICDWTIKSLKYTFIAYEFVKNLHVPNGEFIFKTLICVACALSWLHVNTFLQRERTNLCLPVQTDHHLYFCALFFALPYFSQTEWKLDFYCVFVIPFLLKFIL